MSTPEISPDDREQVDAEVRRLRLLRLARDEHDAEVIAAADADGAAVSLLVAGGAFILDQPDGIPALWGTDDDVLWPEGEALMVGGPPGVGKTTLAGQVVLAGLGIGDATVLGLPVRPMHRVLYLAMDRPRQIARALRRRVRPEDRAVLDERLVVWQGPPPSDLAKNPRVLLSMAQRAGADVVVVDSLKDAAIGLSDDEVGASYNRARQTVLAAGLDVLEVHHNRKQAAGGAAGTSLADLYGSTWLTSGAGSVVMLSGEAGDPVVQMRHVKQPAAEVGPFRLLHDQTAGEMTVQHTTDLVALAAATGDDGLTARAAAVAVFQKDDPSRAEVEKARRRLDGLARSGQLERRNGVSHAGTGASADTWATTVTGGVMRTFQPPEVTDPSRVSRSEANPEVTGVTGTVTGDTGQGCHAPGGLLEDPRRDPAPLEGAQEVVTDLLGGRPLDTWRRSGRPAAGGAA